MGLENWKHRIRKGPHLIEMWAEPLPGADSPQSVSAIDGAV